MKLDFESLFHNAKNPILIIDRDLRLQACNVAACNLFRVTEAVLGTTIIEVIPFPEITDLVNHLPERTTCELTLPTSQQTYAITASVIADQGYLLIFHDVTILKEISLKKSELVNNLSRDLRSPLTAILGYVELLERIGELNEQQQNFVGRIIFSVQSITSLLNHLLDLDRIETGGDVANEFVQMRMIVNYAIDGLRERIRDRAQTLEVFIAEALPTVIGNPIRLRQMVNHILENATQYTNDGGYIRIDLFEEDSFILLAISDTGIGISQEELPYIFEKFYRGSNATPLKPDSSGLGLTIVKTVVDQHNGRIWVESQLESGTTVTIMLPSATDDIGF